MITKISIFENVPCELQPKSVLETVALVKKTMIKVTRWHTKLDDLGSFAFTFICFINIHKTKNAYETVSN